MAGELRHRGPDGTGLLMDGPAGLINTRLAIIDPSGGDQPISCSSGRFWVVQNGEIYNYVELRTELEQLGCTFGTSSDTEVLVNAWSAWGPGCLDRLNGEFAFALWDSRDRELFLARDRFGVRPLYLAETTAGFAFASEVRALLRLPGLTRRISPSAVVQTFELWSTLPGTSAFEGVHELPGGHWLRVRPDGRRQQQRWWDLDFSSIDSSAGSAELAEELLVLLRDSVRLRTRADVQVGAYVSGGLDSSATSALLRQVTGRTPPGFSLGFSDQRFDESSEQDLIAQQLGLDLQRITVSDGDIGRLFPRTVELCERPMLRTAPAPLFMLSELARSAGVRVVLTGEGADELFGGYSIFKETQLRRFWARDPESRLRPLLFQRLHPYLDRDPSRGAALVASWFGAGLTETDDPLYSHHNRIRNGQRNLRFLSQAALDSAGDPAEQLLGLLPERFSSFDSLGKAQYLEITTFLHGFLLHSQGDRMLMGNGVEGRFPFLDHRVAEFAMRLPARLRLNGLTEKYLLRRAVSPLLPAAVSRRTKRPYRAPLLAPFLAEGAPEWVADVLDPANISRSGLFDPDLTSRLVAKVTRNLHSGTSETDEMAVTGIVSTLLLHERMVESPRLAQPAVPQRVIDLNRMAAA